MSGHGACKSEPSVSSRAGQSTRRDATAGGRVAKMSHRLEMCVGFVQSSSAGGENAPLWRRCVHGLAAGGHLRSRRHAVVRYAGQDASIVYLGHPAQLLCFTTELDGMAAFDAAVGLCYEPAPTADGSVVRDVSECPDEDARTATIRYHRFSRFLKAERAQCDHVQHRLHRCEFPKLHDELGSNASSRFTLRALKTGETCGKFRLGWSGSTGAAGRPALPAPAV